MEKEETGDFHETTIPIIPIEIRLRLGEEQGAKFKN